MSPKLKLLLSLLLSIVYSVPAFAQAGKMRNGLPPTSMDSFVYEAGGNAELIYGDEGVTNIPPYFEFTYEHRINNGIFGTRDAGLTDGHGSYMPSAWGDDEFLGAEWSQSGHNGGNARDIGGNNNTTPAPKSPTHNPTGNPAPTTRNQAAQTYNPSQVPASVLQSFDLPTGANPSTNTFQPGFSFQPAQTAFGNSQSNSMSGF